MGPSGYDWIDTGSGTTVFPSDGVGGQSASNDGILAGAKRVRVGLVYVAAAIAAGVITVQFTHADGTDWFAVDVPTLNNSAHYALLGGFSGRILNEAFGVRVTGGQPTQIEFTREL